MALLQGWALATGLHHITGHHSKTTSAEYEHLSKAEQATPQEFQGAKCSYRDEQFHFLLPHFKLFIE